VGPQCPSPESWRGREEELERRVARDVRIAFRALARRAPVDTARYLVVGGRQLAHVAADAAELDRRVHLLMLVSPEPPEVERGRMRARLAARRLPVFLQVAVMDAAAVPVADLMFHAVDERVSRLVESRLPGSGAEVFRLDTTAFPRLRSWLAERWSPPGTAAPPAKRSPRRSPPPPG